MAELTEPTKPFVIVLGLDEADKPHASVFNEPDAALAEKAAGLMDMMTIRIEGEDLMAVAAGLPTGKIFASGNGFVPFVKRQVYDRLVALGEAAGTITKPPKLASGTTLADTGPDGTGGPPDGQGEVSAPHLPTTLETVMVGSLIGVSEGRGEGWYEAIVVELAPADALEDDLLTCQYLDWPDYPRQVRRRADVALLPASANTP